MRALSEKQELAVNLRKQGASLKEIAKTIGVAKSSVSLWVRNVEIPLEFLDGLKKAQLKGGKGRKEKCELVRLKYQEDGMVLASKNEPLHLKGCMLYWAEGEKTRNQCSIINTDPDLLKTFVDFIRKYFPDASLKIEIFSYLNNNLSKDEIQQYWTQYLLITDVHRFVVYDSPRGKKEGKHKYPYGLCKVRIAQSTHIVQHIFGAIRYYGNLDNPYYLD